MSLSHHVSFIFDQAYQFYQGLSGVPRLGASFGYFTNHPIAPLNRARTQEILEHIESLPGMFSRRRIVDFACGGGIISAVLEHAGNSVLGIDLDDQELKFARAFAQYTNTQGRFLLGQTSNQDWEDVIGECFPQGVDIFLFGYALHHFEDVEQFVSRLGKFMEVGSYVVVNEENPNSPLFQLKNRVRTWIQNDTECEHQRPVAGWDALLEKNGFERVRYTAVDFLPVSLIGKSLAWSYIVTYKKVRS